MSIIPGRQNYIRGFVYTGRTGQVAYTPDEIVWLRYFNPLEEYAGLSPVAPARLAIDMGKDGLRFNRNFLRNSAQPDFVLLTNENRTPGIPPKCATFSGKFFSGGASTSTKSPTTVVKRTVPAVN